MSNRRITAEDSQNPHPSMFSETLRVNSSANATELGMETSRRMIEYRTFPEESCLLILLMMLALETDLVCPLCHQFIMDSAFLPCGHAYCSFCIHNWLAVSDTCPMCQERTKETEKGRIWAIDSFIDELYPLALELWGMDRVHQKYSVSRVKPTLDDMKKEFQQEILILPPESIRMNERLKRRKVNGDPSELGNQVHRKTIIEIVCSMPFDEVTYLVTFTILAFFVIPSSIKSLNFLFHVALNNLPTWMFCCVLATVLMCVSCGYIRAVAASNGDGDGFRWSNMFYFVPTPIAPIRFTLSETNTSVTSEEDELYTRESEIILPGNSVLDDKDLADFSRDEYDELAKLVRETCMECSSIGEHSSVGERAFLMLVDQIESQER